MKSAQHPVTLVLTLTIAACGGPDEASVAATSDPLTSHHPRRSIRQTAFGAADEAGDRFGDALATGDFDADGYIDLVVGGPFEDNHTIDNGYIAVAYGGPGGLLTGGRQYLTQQGVFGESRESGDRFGSALAVGDFDRDGYDDVAVGAPYEDRGGHRDTGAVVVFYGASHGLRVYTSDVLDQTHVSGAAREAYDRFGWSLAAGDFDGDTYDDLAVGIPYEDDQGGRDIGVVAIVFGSNAGVRSGRSEVISHGPIPNAAPESYDRFGYTMVAGNFDDDAFDDLAVAAPFEDKGSIRDVGAVSVIYGSPAGLLPVYRSRTFLKDVFFGATAEPYDDFGYALTTGDFDGDDIDDLAIGIPFDKEVVPTAGAVAIVHGSSVGLVPTAGYLVRQEPAEAEQGDNFGRSLASGDFDRDGFDDIAVGIPYEDSSDRGDNGAVAVLFGNPSRSQITRRDWFDESIVGVPEPSDAFGLRLAAADFDGDDIAELVIGSPLENLGSRANSGLIFVVPVEPGLPSGLTARSAIVIDRVTGAVIGAKRADVRRHIASTTKIMTALLVVEAIAAGTLALTDIVTVSAAAGRMSDPGSGNLAGGSIMGDLGETSPGSGQDMSDGLSAGDTISIQDLLFGLMLDSANDASIALAEAVSGTEAAFVAAMNNRAAQLGLNDTSFRNPHGRDPQRVDDDCGSEGFQDPDCRHFSTARDLARLARFALGDPNFAQVVQTATYTWTNWTASGTVDTNAENSNRLIRSGAFNYPGAYGVKTGTTGRADACLVSAATGTIVSPGVVSDVIAVVLGAEDNTARYEESARILDFGHENYPIPPPVIAGP